MLVTIIPILINVVCEMSRFDQVREILLICVLRLFRTLRSLENDKIIVLIF